MRHRVGFVLSLAFAGCSAASPTTTQGPTSASSSSSVDAKSPQIALENAPSPISSAPSASASTDPPAAVPAAPSESASSSKVDDAPRIGSLRYITWIVEAPEQDARKIGYLREGTSVRLKSADKVAGGGCGGGWYAIEPFGFVCKDGSATLDMTNPLLVASKSAKQNDESVLPFRYAFSTGAPMYNHVPTEKEQIKAEGPADKRPKPQKLGSWSSGHEELSMSDAIEASDEMPAMLRDGKNMPVHWGTDSRVVRKWIPNGSMVAYTAAFRAEGRTWLLSPDLTLVPADRVKPFRTSTFHGVELHDGMTLPIAWARHDAVTKWKKTEGGFEALEDKLPPRTFVKLADGRVEQGHKVFLATAEENVFVLESDVVVAKKRDKLPFSIKEGEKWLEVHIRTGTLVAYVGTEPVFATLVSPGAGGVGPYDGTNEQLVKLSTTPLGTYRTAWKTRAAAMSPDKGEPTTFWISDVPYTQYFRAPFALHVTYWHEDFGMPKSAGCVNVSPEDGKFLFGWTGPTIPEGWQGVGPGKDTGSATAIIVAP